jgi:hypothetical protein
VTSCSGSSGRSTEGTTTGTIEKVERRARVVKEVRRRTREDLTDSGIIEGIIGSAETEINRHSDSFVTTHGED